MRHNNKIQSAKTLILCLQQVRLRLKQKSRGSYGSCIHSEDFYLLCHNYSKLLENLVAELTSFPALPICVLFLHVIIKTPFKSLHLF